MWSLAQNNADSALMPAGGTDAGSLAELEKARVQYEELLKQNPNDQEALRRLIMVLFDMGRYAEALDLLEKAPADVPDVSGAAAPDLPLPAVPALAPAPAPAPPVPAAEPAPEPKAAPEPLPSADPAREQEDAAKLEKSRAAFEARLAENPDDQVALRGLIQTLFDLGRHDEALRLLEKAPSAAGAARAAATEPVTTAPRAAAAPAPAPRTDTPEAKALARELAQAREELTAARRQIAEQEKAHAAFRESSRQKETALAEMIEGLDRRVRESAKTVAETKQALEKLREQYETLQALAERHRAQYDAHMAELRSKEGDADARVAALTAELAKERALRAAVEKKAADNRAAMEAMLAGLKQAVAGTTGELAAAERAREVEKVRTEQLRKSSVEAVELLAGSVEELTAEAAIAGGRLDRLAAELAAARAAQAPAAPAAPAPAPVRSIDLDLDLVLGDTPAQTEINLGRFLGRAVALEVNTVYIRAYSDADGDGLAEAMHFPTAAAEVRSDLLKQAAEQCRNRGLAVLACMPTLAVKLTDAALNEALLVLESKNGCVRPAFDLPRRLTPFDPRTFDALATICTDLVSRVKLDGILFEDDAFLTDLEDFNPAALAAAEQVLGARFADPAALSESRRIKWTRLKTRQINALLRNLQSIASAAQPELRFARAVYAPLLTTPAAEQWLAQNYRDAVRDCDVVVVKVDPEAAGVRRADAWLKSIVTAAAGVPDALSKTVFKVNTRDTLKDRWIAEDALRTRIGTLRQLGAEHVACGPDDFAVNRPRLDALKDALSMAPPGAK